MDLFKLMGTIAITNKDANSALDEISDKGQKAESKLGKAFSAVGKGAVAVGKTVATGLAVGGAAVAGLVTKSVQSYADYEQLVGGIETLFKDSAGKMQDYADRAYETAGLSANEYMETATSFAASLLQSVGNDTAKAADKADMAIQDMSDNANKMGTDMSMIQNAYQGFAKQNYTMLDNLKLGYGGTKEEMQRLLEDATKLSGVEYDLSSYADVVDAIHVIQDEMGITGTTAKEASSTISGSIGTMKGAWQNLLTALSGDGWDLGVYVSNFVDSVSTVVKNLIPVISTALDGVVQLIDQLAPIIIAEIPKLFSQLLPPILKAATGLIQSIADALPDLINTLVGILPDLIDAVMTIVDTLIDSLPTIIESIVAALPTLLPKLIEGVISLILSLCEAIPQIITPIIDYLPAIIISIVNALLQNLPALIEGVIALVMGIVEAIPQIIQTLVDALPQIISMIITGLLNNLPAIIGGLCQVVWGIVKAIPQIFGSLIEGVVNIFKGLWDGLCNVFAPIGEWINTNVVQPVVGFFQKLWEGVKNVWDGIVNAVKIAIQFIGSILKAAFDIITLPFRFIWENCKEYVFAAFEWIKEKIQAASNWISNLVKTVWGWIRDNIVQPIQDVYNKAVEIFEKIKSAISEKITAVKEKVTNIFNSVKTTVTNVFDNIKSKISNVVNNIKTTVTNVFNKVKEAMEKPIQKAKDTIQGIVDKIKGFFSGLKLKFPNIKLPHFGISPSGWKIGDLLKGSIPKLSIDWYAKGGILTKPTIFDYDSATGTAKVGGESGHEAVAPIDTLRQYIREEMQAENNGVVERLERIVDMLTQFFPDALIAMQTPMVLDANGAAVAMAPAMNKELGKLTIRKGRGR